MPHLIFHVPLAVLTAIGFILGLGVAGMLWHVPPCPPGWVHADSLCPGGYGPMGCL